MQLRNASFLLFTRANNSLQSLQAPPEFNRWASPYSMKYHDDFLVTGLTFQERVPLSDSMRLWGKSRQAFGSWRILPELVSDSSRNTCE